VKTTITPSINSNNVILGGGVTGLYVAERLSKESSVVVLEKREKIGGMCSTFKHKDCFFDLGPHKFYTQLFGINEEFLRIVGEGNYNKVKKKNSVFLKGKRFQFPVKITELVFGLNPFLSLKFLTSFGLNLVNNLVRKRKIKNYEDYFIKGFGPVGYKLLFYGFAKKVWGNPKDLSPELAKKRSPVSSVFDLVKKMIFERNNPNVNAEYFFYPKKGFGAICDNLSNTIKNNGSTILTNSNLNSINHSNNHIDSVRYSVIDKNYDLSVNNLISTIRLPELITLLNPKPNPEVISAAKNLKFRSLILVYIIVNKPKALEDNWIFFPEKEYIFNRLSEQKSFSSELFPSNKTGIIAEITCDKNSTFFEQSDTKIFDLVIKDLEKANLLHQVDVLEFFTIRVKDIYPVYSLDYEQNLSVVMKYLNTFDNLFSLGRMGLFNYNNCDHCLDMGYKFVRYLKTENKSHSQWVELLSYFNDYRIVD